MKKYIFATMVCFICILGLSSIAVLANAPPSEEHIQELIENGKYEEASENAFQTENNILNSNLLINDNDATQSNGDGAPPQMMPDRVTTLPSIGKQNVLVLLVDFSDRQHTINQTVAAMENKMFGNGETANYPYESVNNYYKRSSYGKFEITGEVANWYRAQNTSQYYENLGLFDGRYAIMKEAIENYVSQGNSIAKYDNDNDGVIEAVYVMFAGNDGNWSSFWWATTYWNCRENRVSGKYVSNFVFMNYSPSDNNANNIGSAVAIHEMGHLLGLPDYYDYTTNLSPYGGTGSLDMMDRNIGDHNGFSKFLLGWIEPDVITNSTLNNKGLRALSEYGDAVILKKTGDINALDEYYLLEYRNHTGNDSDSKYSGVNGMCIWHIDARTANGECLYNNSTGDHKLISRVEADGNNATNSKYGDWKASRTDFYTSGKVFTNTSNPNTKWNDGSSSGFSVTEFSVDNGTIYSNYSSTSLNAPTFISMDYTVGSNTVKLKFDCSITANSLNDITLYRKNGIGNEYVNITNRSISGNSVVLELNECIIFNSKYVIYLPQNAVANSTGGIAEGTYTVNVNEVDKNASDDFNVLNVKFLDNNYSEINNIPDSTTMIRGYCEIEKTANASIKPNVVIAVYKNNVLKAIQSEEYDLTTQESKYKYFTIALPVGAASDCTVKLFIWNGYNQLNPMVNAYVLN